MNMRDLISWTRGSGQTPDLFREDRLSGFASLQREMNRLLEDAFRGFEAPALFGRGQNLTAMNWPKIEVNETDAQMKVLAELPGLDEKDIDLSISDGALVIRGEKKAEVEDKNRQFSERFYGRFERQIPLGVEIEEDKVEASFKNGVLTVTLPKSARAQTKMKHIEINAPTKH